VFPKRILTASWRAVRYAPDRAFHPLRRNSAISGISGRIPRSVLFICYGNVCRSPYAAAVFSKRWPGFLPKVAVSSAGFVGPGRGSPDQALAAASRRGIDLGAHRSTLVFTQAVRSADLIVVMSASQARSINRVASLLSAPLVLGDLDPKPILTRTIVDPWGLPDEVFDESYERIDRCIDELIRHTTSAIQPKAERE